MAILTLQPKNLTYQAYKLKIKWLGNEKLEDGIYYEWCYYELLTRYVEPDGTVTEREFVTEIGNEWLPQMAKIWEKDPVTYETEINMILATFKLSVLPGPVEFPESSIALPIPSSDEAEASLAA